MLRTVSCDPASARRSMSRSLIRRNGAGRYERAGEKWRSMPNTALKYGRSRINDCWRHAETIPYANGGRHGR